MPKIISGKLKGRNVKGYDILGTRPTMDRVKESIFAMIQDYLLNSVVLDLFSGTGNYGIECISNGSKIVYFNDLNKKCIQTIKDNLREFNISDNSYCTNMDYREALNYYSNRNIQFDLVFLDPPYKDRIINDILEILLKKNMLKDRGLIICEMNNSNVYINNYLKLFKERKYGDKIVYIYQYIK